MVSLASAFFMKNKQAKQSERYIQTPASNSSYKSEYWRAQEFAIKQVDKGQISTVKS